MNQLEFASPVLTLCIKSLNRVEFETAFTQSVVHTNPPILETRACFLVLKTSVTKPMFLWPTTENDQCENLVLSSLDSTLLNRAHVLDAPDYLDYLTRSRIIQSTPSRNTELKAE